MRRTKLHRSRRSVFGRRRMPGWLKSIIWLFVCVAIVAAGYFGAMLTSKDGTSQLDTAPSHSDTPVLSPTDDETTNPTDAEQPETDESPNEKPIDTPTATKGSIRAFYLPVSELSVDTLGEVSTLQDAAAAGFNAVVFDLKDANGKLYYKFTCSQAKKAKAYADNALSAKNLTALLDLIRDAGLQPIPRLYAFRDDLAAKELADARVMLESNHGWSWYDGDPSNGGRRWLNPYSEAAQDYIGALAEELKEKGAAAILLDGVEFPSQTGSAYFGEDAATISKSDVLTSFVAKTRSLLGDECPLLLSCSAESALGTDTKVYGGNPLTFGPWAASPTLNASKLKDPIQDTLKAMNLRIKVLEDDQKPILIPTLLADGLSAKKINALLADCADVGAESFILDLPDGDYDFAAYDLP